MSVLEAALAAYASRDGRAYRLPNFRHRRLAGDPIALVAFQLGGEPFAVAAMAYGCSCDAYELAVPGQPLDRVQLFATLLPVARWFNQQFEVAWGLRQDVEDGVRSRRTVQRAPYSPQVIVTNPGTAKLLKLVGRRLAYLPTEQTTGGPPPAPEELVRFGRHLAFLARHYREPGQQILVDMTTLIASSWITAQTPGERANLAAIDAWVEPPADVDGFVAAAQRETVSAGPIPTPAVERQIEEMVDRLGAARNANDAAAEAAARAEISAVYRELVDPAWDLMWRVRDREARWPEEPRYTARRVEVDVVAYSAHMEWMDGPAGGRRRARDTVRAAIRGRRHAENVIGVVNAEQVCSDPTLMISYLLDHKAAEGELDPFDFDHREVRAGNTRASSVPRIRLRTARPSLIPVGKELWWAQEPEKVKVMVEETSADPMGPGSVLVLKVLSGANGAALPLRTISRACFSVLTTSTYGDYAPMPATDPFTHIPERAETTAQHIEPEGDTPAAASAP